MDIWVDLSLLLIILFIPYINLFKRFATDMNWPHEQIKYFQLVYQTQQVKEIQEKFSEIKIQFSDS